MERWFRLACALAALPARAALATTYADGSAHTVNGPSDEIVVADSLLGQSTTLNIVTGADIATVGSGFDRYSVQTQGSNGGAAIVNMSGGTLEVIKAHGGSMLNITGGQTTADLNTWLSLQPDLGTSVIVDISGGNFQGSIRSAFFKYGTSCVHISGGTFGKAFPLAESASVDGRLEISDGSFEGYVAADTLHVSGGTFGGGAFMGDGEVSGGDFAESASVFGGGETVRAKISGGTFGFEPNTNDSLHAIATNNGRAIVRVTGGTFERGIDAEFDTRIRVAGGTFGGTDTSFSIEAQGSSDGGISVVNVSGGTFDGGARADFSSRIRLSGGSFGGSIPMGLQPMSVAALTMAAFPLDPEEKPVVEIFGGSFAEGLFAGHRGTIHVYGTGLNLAGGMLTGTLADGTPINASVVTDLDGQVVLHDVGQVLILPASYLLLSGGGGGVAPIGPIGSKLTIPVSILPDFTCVPPGGQPGPTAVAMASMPIGDFDFGAAGRESTGNADMVLRTVRDANGPGSDSIPVELLALHLMSLEPVDLGSFAEHLFFTLQSERGGAASGGQIDIDFSMRDFDLTIDLFFDVRTGALDGPILFSAQDQLRALGIPWSPDAPVDAFVLRGINDGLFAGVIGGAFVGFDLEGQSLIYGGDAAAVPEPSSGMAVICLCGLMPRRLRRRHAPRSRTNRASSGWILSRNERLA